ncbi:MAG: hypothetical protein VW268_08540 [Rhodospirillaceae bacterium]
MNDFVRLPASFGRRATEPNLDDVLGDPVVHLVMARDGVTLDEIRDVAHEARSRLLMRSLIEDPQGSEGCPLAAYAKPFAIRSDRRRANSATSSTGSPSNIRA